MHGKAVLRDADERTESLELRLKYVARFEKLLRRPQAKEVLRILRRYGRNCIPIPCRTERHYWSVSCLPSTPGKALVRVNDAPAIRRRLGQPVGLRPTSKKGEVSEHLVARDPGRLRADL
jgi:hypothetical protein